MVGIVPDLRFSIQALDGTAAAFASVRGQVDRTRASLAGARSEAAGLRTSLTGFAGGLAAGIGFAALTTLPRLIGNVVEQGARLTEVADKVGLTTDALQELRYAAEQTGVASSQLDVAMQRFARRTAEAASGTGVLKPILEANNIALRDQDGQLRSSREVLGDYADLIKNARSEQDKLRLAFLAFDTEGAALVNTLRDGSDGLDEFAESYDSLGAKIDRESLDEMAELDRRLKDIGTSLEGFAARAVVAGADAIGRHAAEMDNLARAAEDFWNNPSARNAMRFLAGESAANFLTPGETPNRAAKSDALEITINPDIPGTVIPPTGGGSGSKRDPIGDTIKGLTFEREQLGRTAREQAIYNALKRAGIDDTNALAGEVSEAAGALYDEEEALRVATEAMDALRDTAKDVLGGFLNDLKDGKSAVEAIGDALDRVSDRLLDSALDGLLGGLFGGGLYDSGQLFAKGGALQGGRVIPFKNGGIVSSPTVFPMANGMGLMGEAGPEAVLPLRRGPGGRLGVDGGRGGGGGVTFAPVTNIDARGAGKGVADELRADLDRRDRDMERRIPAIVQQAQDNARFA